MVVTGITDAQSNESDESDELDADDLAEAVLEFDCTAVKLSRSMMTTSSASVMRTDR